MTIAGLKIEKENIENKSNENTLITKASNDWYVHGVYKLGKKEEENSCESLGGATACLPLISLHSPRLGSFENSRNYKPSNPFRFNFQQWRLVGFLYSFKSYTK